MKAIHRAIVFGVLLLQVPGALLTPVIDPVESKDRTELLSEIIHHHGVQNVFTSAEQEVSTDRNVLSSVLLDANNTGLHRHKQKRGWLAVVFKGLMEAEHLTSLGLNLAQAVKGGCVYYPSICSDSKEIERLDKNIQANLNKFDAAYKSSKIDFLALRTVSNNNAYINYYINKTLRSVEQLKEIQSTILLQLEVDFPELARIAESGNQTANAYLKSLLGPLEFTLSDIKNMLNEERKEAFIGLVVEVSVETLVNNFIKGYQKTYNEVQRVEKVGLTKSYFGLLDENGVELDSHIRGKYLQAEHVSSTLLEDIEMSPKVLGKMLKSTFIEKPTNLVHAVKEIGGINTWEGFKDTFSHVLKKPLATFDKVHEFFYNPKYRKFTIENFKVGWSEGLMSTITLISDVISQAMAAKQYHEAAIQVTKSRKQYEEYDANLRNELVEIHNETMNMNVAWLQVIDSFKNSSLTFRKFVQDALQYANFSEALGEANLGVNLNNPLFHTNFGDVERSNLEEKQNAVIGYLKSVSNDMTKVTDKLRSRHTLYSIVLKGTNVSTKLAEILKEAHQAYEYDTSETVKSYGNNLTEQDIVCSVAILRPTLKVYDSFPLVTFRPRCQVTSSAFANMRTAAQAKQKNALLFQAVATNVRALQKSNMENLELVYSLVVGQIGNGDSTKVSKHLVLCAIANQFPTMQSYDHNSLSSLRTDPECSPS